MRARVGSLVLLLALVATPATSAQRLRGYLLDLETDQPISDGVLTLLSADGTRGGCGYDEERADPEVPAGEEQYEERCRQHFEHDPWRAHRRAREGRRRDHELGGGHTHSDSLRLFTIAFPMRIH